MQATDRIKKKAKLSIIVQTAANILLKAVISSSRAPIVFNNNIFFSCLFNILQGIIILTPQNLDAKIARLMKERKCFNCKKKGHTIFNCLKKAKISAITDTSDIDSESIDRGKK